MTFVIPTADDDDINTPSHGFGSIISCNGESGFFKVCAIEAEEDDQ
jgi:hypothetical protein